MTSGCMWYPFLTLCSSLHSVGHKSGGPNIGIHMQNKVQNQRQVHPYEEFLWSRGSCEPLAKKSVLIGDPGVSYLLDGYCSRSLMTSSSSLF